MMNEYDSICGREKTTSIEKGVKIVFPNGKTKDGV